MHEALGRILGESVLRPSITTHCLHGGVERNRRGNAPFIPPIYQTSLFHLGSSADAEALFSGGKQGYTYSRFGNPTVDELCRLLSELEAGEDALLTASGNAATFAALCMSLRGKGDRILSHPDLYGGTLELLRLFETRLGVPVILLDPARDAAWELAARKASVIFVETPSNPLLRLVDLKRCGVLARASGARFVVDNTVATPLGQRPFEFGADLVVHSLSKYLNGHSDLIAGCVISRGRIDDRSRAVHKNLGATVSALTAHILGRGLRTFPLRMAAHHAHTPRVARYLEAHPNVARVHYPGLPGHPQADLVARQMKHPGALLSFELKGGESSARRFLDSLRLVVHAVSLGGMETLATRPAATSHRGMSPAARRRAGISDGLIRLSVGVEPVDEILGDLAQALTASARANATRRSSGRPT